MEEGLDICQVKRNETYNVMDFLSELDKLVHSQWEGGHGLGGSLLILFETQVGPV